MHKRSIRVAAVLAVAIVTALAGADRASAAGAVSISACQFLSDPDTTYKLTTDLTSCGNCLVVDANKVTIDLQGHSITNTICPGNNSAIHQNGTFDVITVKNGSVSGYQFGIFLFASTRVSVIGVKAKDNSSVGILAGDLSLVKSSEASGNPIGIQVGARGQVQQCNSHDNFLGILAFGDTCLITMNTASNNSGFGIVTDGNRCMVSYNTANNNGDDGIDVTGTGHLVTQNVAMDNGSLDFGINCPSTVTYNTSTNGFPASYFLSGTGCHLVNNN